MECVPTKISYNITVILECHGRVWLVAGQVELARKQKREKRALMRHKHVNSGGVRCFLVHQYDPDPRDGGQDRDPVIIP